MTEHDPLSDEMPSLDDPSPVPAAAIPGGEALSPAGLGFHGWKAVLKRIYVMNNFHGLPLLAAGMAFYAFLTIAPAFAAMVMLYGLIGDPAMVASQMQTVITIVPRDVAGIIQDQLLAIVTVSSGFTGIALVIALFFAIFGAMRASGAAIQALNIVYEEHESRSFVRSYSVNASLTVGAIGLALTGIIAASAFAWLENATSGMIGPIARDIAQIVTWMIAALLACFAFAAVYRWAPDRRRAKWRWLTLGSIAATALWIVASFGFGLYITYVTDYNATYGSLGAVVASLMWLWLSCYAVLIGGLINAESERQTSQDSTIGPDRPIGERGAVMADNQALDAASAWLLEKKRRRKSEREARRATRTTLGLPRRLRRDKE